MNDLHSFFGDIQKSVTSLTNVDEIKGDIACVILQSNQLEGKIKKFYTEVCLLDQTFVRSDLFEGSVSGYVANVAKAIGADIKVTGFTRLAKGEGIEKKVDDFAAEVAAQMAGN